ncbi:MAG: zf-HC2 domain-containing protein, partial [Acidimicrobiales bacterium]
MTPRSCPAWRGRLAMWAVDGLDPAEADLVATHLDGCAACREEADELEAVVHLLSKVDAASIDLAEASVSDRDDTAPLVAPGTGGRGTGSPEPVGSW